MRGSSKVLLLLASLSLCLHTTVAKPPPRFDIGGIPLWHPLNHSSQSVFLRSPEFSIPTTAGKGSRAMLYITAKISPLVLPVHKALTGEAYYGETKRNANGDMHQGVLICSYKLWINGILVSAGPGHSFPATAQAVNAIDVGSFLRPSGGAPNVLAVSAFFSNSTQISTFADANPRVQAALVLTDSNGNVNTTLIATSEEWLALDASAYMSPTGETGTTWYAMPNENLQLDLFPRGWSDTNFSADARWQAAVIAPEFVLPYLEESPAPVMLTRTACSVTPISSARKCGAIPEMQTLQLMCSQDGSSIIDSIVFASFGTPSGTCENQRSGQNNFFHNSTCDSSDSSAVVTAACLGKAFCNLNATNAAFGGDPCDKTPKRLAVAITCRGQENASSSYLIDYGQEFDGGVNLTFAGWAGGGSVEIVLGEALESNGTGPGVQSPLKTGNIYASTWTLSALNSAANAGITQHEMVQFRFAEVRGSPVPLTREHAKAWVVQHSGANPFENVCSTSTRNVDAWAAANGGLSPPLPVPAAATWVSSDENLDAVFNFTAYTAIASAVDLNVDSRTRQRSLCDVDAAITAAMQYAVFAGGDYSYQRKTARLALDTITTGDGMWMEFSYSDVLMAYYDARDSGDLTLVRDAWGADNSTKNSDGDLYTLQRRAGVRFYNAVRGQFTFSSNCDGEDASACAPLVDWPTTTRDGYILNTQNNTEDAIRNGFGVISLNALADIAKWLGFTTDAARYVAYAASTKEAMLSRQLRWNGSEAFLVDGTHGAAALHAAVHSTVYAAAAGVADGNATLAAALGNYLARRDVLPSSCMTGRWYVEACFRLGYYAAAPADYAIELLSRKTYPGWGYMLFHENATMSLEAWAWKDKWNTDAGHPWCGSPAFLIPRFIMGATATGPGWVTWKVAPQPSRLTMISTTVGTPYGAAVLQLLTTVSSGSANLTLSLTVPVGTAVEVCLPLPGDALAQAAIQTSTLWVDGMIDSGANAWGRFLCATNLVNEGNHVVERRGLIF